MLATYTKPEVLTPEDRLERAIDTMYEGVKLAQDPCQMLIAVFKVQPEFIIAYGEAGQPYGDNLFARQRWMLEQLNRMVNECIREEKENRR